MLLTPDAIEDQINPQNDTKLNKHPSAFSVHLR